MISLLRKTGSADNSRDKGGRRALKLDFINLTDETVQPGNK
jgi:hypothetical protein